MDVFLHVDVEDLGIRSGLVSDGGAERYIDVELRSSVAVVIAGGIIVRTSSYPKQDSRSFLTPSARSFVVLAPFL